MKRPIVYFCSCIFIGGALLWSLRDEHAQRASAQQTKPLQKDNRSLEELQAEIARLASDVAVLKDKIPDQAHSMMDVDYHFSNLWFAGRAENWPLAKFYWGEAVSHMKWAVRIIPVRKDTAGNEVKLEAILKSILESPWMQVGQTIEQQDVAEFEKAYKFTLGGCYTCHKAADKPYLRPQVPQRPASPIINFEPAATWPE